MTLKEGLTEVGWEVDIVPCVGQGANGLKVCNVARVQKMFKAGWRGGWDGGSFGGACHQDD